ncbi:MAG: acyl-CoA dehydrogenase family protein [Pseudomonadales bacterium]
MPESLAAQYIELRDRTREFIDKTLAPLEAQIEAREAIPAAIRRKLVEASQAAGFFGMTQPTVYGGTEAGPLAMTVIRETLAAANLRLTGAVFGPGPGVLASAEGYLRENYLEPQMRGEKSSAFGFTEPDDAPAPTSARREGDRLVVNGAKSYVSGGDRADFINVVLQVEPSDVDGGGAAVLVVDRDTAGLEIEHRFETLDGSSHVFMRFTDMRVPATHIVGKVGEGMPRAMRQIGDIRISLSAQACGIMLWTLDYITEHLKAPHRSGTPLGAREGVRLRYADMRIQAYAARSMLYRTARLAQAEENVINEGIATKVFTTEAVGRIVDQALQLAGGNALVLGHPLEALYRRVRAMRFTEGASDVLRLNLARGRLDLDKGRI